MEIVFVLAPSQNRFFFEMAEALVFELRHLGVASSITTEGFPPLGDGRVYALLPPHEYFVLEGHEQEIDEAALGRTIFISAEQPTSVHFRDNVRLAPFAGAVFDINAGAVRAYSEAGVHARQLQLGYSVSLDRFDPDGERDYDVVFMGCSTQRRLEVLAGCAPALSSLQSRIVLSDNSKPNTHTSPTFLAGDAKKGLLQRSASILNIHQTTEPYFEWARVLDAIHCGTVVISEHSTDFAPLIAGEHFIASRPESLPFVITEALRDGPLLDRLRKQAYEMIRERIPLSSAATLLAQTATDLTRRPLRPRPEGPAASETVDSLTHIDFGAEAEWHRRPEPTQIHPHTVFPPGDPEVAAIRRVLKEMRLDLMDLRRATARNSMIAAGQTPPSVRRVAATPAYHICAKPRVSILTAMYNHGSEIGETLESLLESDFIDWELIVVDDGSTDSSQSDVRSWMDLHPEVPILLLCHPVNRGLGHARNSALAHARSEYMFVLDSDNSVYRNGIGDLVSALDSAPDATFVYGMLASFRNDQPFNMISVLPWEPQRLTLGNYIDAMALFRTEVVRSFGGYTTDRRLYGWEDYDLYCRFAEARHHGELVPHIVARYRSSETSMLAVSNISHSAAFTALKEHAPRLMEHVIVPS